MFPALPLCKRHTDFASVRQRSSGPYAYLDEANNKVILFLADPAVSSSRHSMIPGSVTNMLWGFFWEQAAG